MKKMLISAAVALVVVSAAFGQSSAGRVAVRQFAAGRGISNESARTVTNLVRTRIGASKVVTLVTRDNFDQILTEMKFQTSDWSNAQKTAAFGEAVNADYLLMGEIDMMDGEIVVTAYMINLKTAEQVASSDIQFSRMNQAREYMAEFTEMFITSLTAEPAYNAPASRAAAIPEGFVRIPSGTFMMGSPSSEVNHESDEVQHQVTVSAFYMGKYEVTQAEYQAVIGANPSEFKGGNLPVEYVSWFDAVHYCNERSKKEGLTPVYTINGDNTTWNKKANGYRLPTEAEWEYACRAGTTTPFSTGFNITTGQANYNGNYPYNNNAKGTYREKTTAVGSFASNAYGLFDMHGNVWEWCWDWYGGYSVAAQTDPSGPSSGSGRVDRGGSWYYDARHLRSAYRGSYSPSLQLNALGFRLVRSEF